MKKFLSVTALALIATTLFSFAYADEYVNGYTRRDGTVVQPYYRSSPDNSYNNNWSVRPKVNPNTGQMGTRAPTFDDRPPPPNSLGNPTYNPNGDPYGTRRSGRY